MSTLLETDDSPEVRAERGAIWFDQVYPEWFTHIDTEALDLDDGCKCVWGQTTGVEFDRGIVFQPRSRYPKVVPTGYDMAAVVLEADEGWFIDNGFLSGTEAEPSREQNDGRLLDRAWTELIEKRKANAGLLA